MTSTSTVVFIGSSFSYNLSAMTLRASLMPIASALCLWLFVPSASAQDLSGGASAKADSGVMGVIIGTVTDPSNKRLPGVTITIKTASGARSVVTDVQGRYRIAGLSLGTYRVVADLAGFTLTAKDIALTSRYPEDDASFVLHIGELKETETVPGAPRSRVWPLGPELR